MLYIYKVISNQSLKKTVMLETIPTTETVKIDSYPYGRLRCTAFYSVEFDKKKGFRCVFQTINPKTGRHNAPKKSTYSDLGILYRGENGHIHYYGQSLNGVKELNKATIFISEHYDKFTAEQREYLGLMCLSMSKLSMKASVIYSGSKVEDLIPIFDKFVKTITQCVKDKVNLFAEALIDYEAYKKCEDPNYNPFRTVSHQVI